MDVSIDLKIDSSEISLFYHLYIFFKHIKIFLSRIKIYFLRFVKKNLGMTGESDVCGILFVYLS
jgi:hypothetical protein